MSDKEDIENALKQMKFEVVEDVIDLPISTPAVFEFESTPTLEKKALESQVDEHDFVVFDIMTQKNESGFYFKADLMTDHYKRCVIKVWKDNAAVYPKDNDLDTYELSRIVHGIEDAFRAELKFVEDY